MEKTTRLLLMAVACFIQDSYCNPTRDSWRENGSPAALAGPPSPEGPGSRREVRAEAMTRPSRPGDGRAPGGLRPGMMLQSMVMMPAIEERRRDVDATGAPAQVKPPGTSKYMNSGAPGSPLSMISDDGEPHSPAPRGSGWRPGPSIEFEEMREPDPASKIRNLTIDQVIVKAYGGLSKTLEAPTEPENQGKIVAELDMVLTPEQYRALYGQSPPSHTSASLRSRPAGRPSAPSGPDNRSPGTGRQSNLGPMPPGDRRRNLNLGPAPPSSSRSDRRRVKRKAFKTRSLRWTDNVVPYEYVFGDFTAQERGAVRAAMDQLESDSCVRFLAAEPWQYNRIRLQHGNGCNSAIGMNGGTQLINLDQTGCRFRGLYLHELNHALGRVHEHQLPDRADHIVIMEQNIMPALRQWFQPYQPDTLDYFGQSYDLTSIMHYGELAFSKDGTSRTLRPKDPSKKGIIGKVFLRNQQSFIDKKVLNSIYNCSGHCDPSIRCRDNGFVNQFCTCECPDGTHGCQISGQVTIDPRRNCENVESDSDCERWTGDGECYVNPVWMETNCRKTCGKCQPGLETPDVPCEDRQSQCKVWAEDGECKTNPDWMMHHCPESCGRCQTGKNNCTDTHEKKRMCEYWASGGECFKNPIWMVDNCRKSCNRCPKGRCYNTYASEDKCYDWAKSGECSSNPTWMGEQCRKACGLCRDPTEVNDAGELCINRHGDRKCVQWAAEDECAKNPQWMQDNCRRSCTKCEERQVPKTNGTAVTPTETPDDYVEEDDKEGGTKPEEEEEEDPDCFNSFKSERKCIDWAKDEECTANPAWMLVNCKKACKGCDKDKGKECLNRYVSDKKCDQWADTGECEANAAWMMKQCTQSCTKCNEYKPKDRICENEYEHQVECDDWAETGECEANKGWMNNNCYKACSKCEPKTNTTVATVNKCIDVHPDPEECRSWKQSNHCEENQAFMMVNCYKTCTGCDPTNDSAEMCINTFPIDEECDEKARLGGCLSNRVWMIDNCYKSCSECDGILRERIIEDRTCININGDKDCDKWSNDGECIKNRFWMKVNCKKSCTECTPIGGRPEVTVSPELCTNEYGDTAQCNEWADDGECQYNTEWMMFYCKMSCSKCDGLVRPSEATKPCRNRHPNREECARWYNDGECEFNHYWMLDNCYEVCTSCSPDTRQPEPQWPPTPKPTTATTTTTTTTEAPTTIMPTPPPWSRCRDRHPSARECWVWKNDGQCQKNPGYMLKNCQWTCEACDVQVEEHDSNCYDGEESCGEWAASGQCQMSPGYMYLHCQRSCGLCDQGCVDLNDLCPRWAESRGYCARNAQFMYPNCPRSCRICSN